MLIIKISHFKHITNLPMQDFLRVSNHFHIRLFWFILIYRSFKVCNKWNSFHNDIGNIKSNLIKSEYPPFLIAEIIKIYFDYKFSSTQKQLKEKSDVHYIKLPYISNLSHHVKNKPSKLCKVFCKKNVNIKPVFSSFRFKN